MCGRTYSLPTLQPLHTRLHSPLLSATLCFFAKPPSVIHASLCCRKRYKKSPSFLSIHTGVRADVLPPGTQCHHIIVEDWQKMESPLGTLFVSIPTLLDPSLSPEGTHIVHIFSPDWINNWKVLFPAQLPQAALTLSIEELHSACLLYLVRISTCSVVLSWLPADQLRL
jgi:hypothetical protein